MKQCDSFSKKSLHCNTKYYAFLPELAGRANKILKKKLKQKIIFLSGYGYAISDLGDHLFLSFVCCVIMSNGPDLTDET